MYASYTKAAYDKPAILRFGNVITLFITLAGTFAMYYMVIQSGVSVADYYAFNTAYGLVSGAFLSLADITMTIANIKPVLEMVRPILETAPEVSEGKQFLSRLSGGIELTNVTFRYAENMPNVVDNLSIKIRPGQYVAFVGATGCGKSTLMRIMLGFETPQKGAVYYDGKDLSGIDLKSLRRRIGTVMQDGKLFQGDIYSNIVISAPWLTLDDAWEAAELAEDMRKYVLDIHKSFTFETVMSTDRNLKLLRRAKEQGYFIRYIYVLTADVNINIHRVMRRFASGGHDVPEDKI